MTPNWEAIIEAGDYLQTTLTEETITEPNAAPGTKRKLTIEHKSVTVGYKVTATIAYREPVSSPAWGAETGRSYVEEAL